MEYLSLWEDWALVRSRRVSLSLAFTLVLVLDTGTLNTETLLLGSPGFISYIFITKLLWFLSERKQDLGL